MKSKYRYFIADDVAIKFWPNGKGYWIKRENKALVKGSAPSCLGVLFCAQSNCLTEVKLKQFRNFVKSTRNTTG